MKNYNNPQVWAEFVREEGLPLDAPPPSIEFCRKLDTAADTLAFLRGHARIRSRAHLSEAERAGARLVVLTSRE